MNANQCRPVVIALLALCACSPVASMERSAVEDSVTAPRVRPLDSAALHRGYKADDPAHIDRLRMAADAGRDDAALQTLTAFAGAGNVAAQRAVGTTLLARGDARSDAEGRRRPGGGGHARAYRDSGRSGLPPGLRAEDNDPG